jgi:hypothetical protein
MPPSRANPVRLEGSERFHKPGTRRIGPAGQAEILRVIVLLRPRPDAPPLPDMEHWARVPLRQRHALPRHDAAADFGAAQEDADKVAAFATASDLKVIEINLPRRMVEVSGTVAQIDHAFGVTLGMYEAPDEAYHGHDGPIHLPRDIVDLVTAVFGLDSRRVAFHGGGPSVTISPVTPPQVADLYGFPAVPPAITSQTIGIFEFGGGYVTDAAGHATDADLFMAGLNPPLPNVKMFHPPVSILGAPNAPGTAAHPNGGDGEVILDINVAASVAVGATIAVYFVPWSELGWIMAILTVAVPLPGQPTPSVVSISWNAPEASFSASQLTAMSGVFKWATTKHPDPVTFLVCTMDDGTKGGVGDGAAHVWWPAIDPWITAVGGTTIGDISGPSFDEITWNDNGITSGGISTVTDSSGHLVFPLPSWQVGCNVPPSINDGKTRGRGIPDIAGYANGYRTKMFGSNAGSWWGTSEAAPFYAGLVAILNAYTGANLGYLNPLFYTLAQTPGFDIFHDIDDGGSNADTFTLPPPNPPTKVTTPGYTSIKGWDACTGWGSIRGNRLLAVLSSLPIVATAIASGGKFGNACVASFVDETLTINNTGFGLLAISNITSSSADFLVPAVSAYPLLVSIGGSIDVVIRFQPVSVGSKTATIKIFSNDAASPHSITVSGDAVTPRLDVAIADTGDFGSVCAGSFVDRPLVLNNSGKCMLSITDITSSSGEFVVPEVLSYPLSIAPGAALPLPIRFAPTSLGAKSATLTVTSNDPASPRKIDVTGDAPPGKLCVTGSTIFGGVKCCTREQRTVSLCNTGACELQVSEVALRHPHRAFRLINNPFPATLRPGSCLSVVIQYRAVEKVPRACELVIHSNDPQTPVKCLDVIGHTIWDTGGGGGCCCEPRKSCCEEPGKSRCEERPKACCNEPRHACCDEDEDEEAYGQ